MNFPKQVMSISELAAMGFDAKRVRQIARTQGFPLAFRDGPSKTSAIKIDTEEFYAYLKRNTQMLERR